MNFQEFSITNTKPIISNRCEEEEDAEDLCKTQV